MPRTTLFFILAVALMPAHDALALKGGRLVAADEIPHANVLVTLDGRWNCGGALVAPRIVATAGHCVTGRASGKPLPPARLGVARAISSFAYDRPLPAVPVARIVVSLDRIPSSVGRDIALLVLDAPLDGTDPAAFATAGVRPGSKVAIFGWGPTAASATETPRASDDPGRARGATFALQGSRACRRHWIFAKLWEQATMLCVDTRRRQLCSGDSGSPAYNARGEIVGLVSLALPGSCVPGRRSPGSSVLSRPDRAFMRTLRRLAESLPATSRDVTVPGEHQGAPDDDAAPAGAVLFVQRTGPASARVIGWAQDPDDLAAAVRVTALVDGVAAGHGMADQPRGDIGPHGFSVAVATDERRHAVCVRATSVGPGPDATIGDCLQIPAYGDLDADGELDCADLDVLKSHYGEAGGVADLNNDGTVNIYDLSILLSRLSATTPSCPATP